MTTATKQIEPSGVDIVRDAKKHLRTTALRAYSGNRSSSVGNQQIVDLLGLVPNIARRTVSYLKPPLSFEDLVAAGVVGLVKAAKNFDPSYKVQFKTYAYIRIRGAILDELKKWNFGPLDIDKQLTAISDAAEALKEQYGAEPSDEQLAQKLRISTARLYEIFEKARARQFLSIHNSSENSPALCEILTGRDRRGPAEKIEQAELANELAVAIKELSEKKRQVVLLYYQQDLTMKEIAQVLNITESRVSQIHAAALFSLSTKLRQWKDGRE